MPDNLQSICCRQHSTAKTSSGAAPLRSSRVSRSSIAALLFTGPSVILRFLRPKAAASGLQLAVPALFAAPQGHSSYFVTHHRRCITVCSTEEHTRPSPGELASRSGMSMSQTSHTARRAAFGRYRKRDSRRSIDHAYPDQKKESHPKMALNAELCGRKR